MMVIDKRIYLMEKRHANENLNEPDNMPMPRIVYRNDILPDVNNLSEMSREAMVAEDAKAY
jgi:hypothetical protein